MAHCTRTDCSGPEAGTVTAPVVGVTVDGEPIGPRCGDEEGTLGMSLGPDGLPALAVPCSFSVYIIRCANAFCVPYVRTPF